jgi:hypothetical protein
MDQGRMGYCLDSKEEEETAAARVRGERARRVGMRAVRCIFEVIWGCLKGFADLGELLMEKWECDG